MFKKNPGKATVIYKSYMIDYIVYESIRAKFRGKFSKFVIYYQLNNEVTT